MAEQPEVADRVASAVDDIDATIKDIRRSIFALSVAADSADLRRMVGELVERAASVLGFTPTLRFEGPVNSTVVVRTRRRTCWPCWARPFQRRPACGCDRR